MEEKFKFVAELLGHRLKDRREQLGLSQPQVAQKAGLNTATVYRIENARFLPDIKTLLKLCYALDMIFVLEDKEGDDPVAKHFRERWLRPNTNN